MKPPPHAAPDRAAFQELLGTKFQAGQRPGSEADNGQDLGNAMGSCGPVSWSGQSW